MTVWTPSGEPVFWPREGTTDATVLREVWRENTYQVKPEDVAGGYVIDLGANVGAFTLWALHHGARLVLAVEPDNDNLRHLIANAMRNDMHDHDRVQPFSCAMGRSVQVYLHGSDGTAWTSDDPEHADARRVSAMSLDELLLQLPSERVPMDSQTAYMQRHLVEQAHLLGVGDIADEVLGDGTEQWRDVPADVAVLKVDIEGAEYEVFAAASDQTIARCRYITMEFHVDHTMTPRKIAPGAFGALVERLAATHHVEVVGRSTVGGMLYARRYES